MMSKEELVTLILNQQSHELEIPEQKTKKQKIEAPQELDWSKYSQRHIALKFAYLVLLFFGVILQRVTVIGLGISWLGHRSN